MARRSNKREIMRNVGEIIKGIAEECKELSKYAMTAHGVNDKSGVDTLTNSDIYNSIDVKYDDDGVITILVDDYIDYIQGGRRPNAKFPWKLALEVLAEWCQKRLGKSDNTTIYFVWKSIIENGIKPRPIFETLDGLWTSPSNTKDIVMEDLTDKYWDKWSSDIFNAVTEDLEYEMSKKE